MSEIIPVAAGLQACPPRKMDEVLRRQAMHLRSMMAAYDDEARLEVWSLLKEGCCQYCGRMYQPGEVPCMCWNDE